jgi:hypothetical protein
MHSRFVTEMSDRMTETNATVSQLKTKLAGNE